MRFDQLVSCGLDKDAVARRARKGHLHVVHYGVYAVGHVSATLNAQFMAAVLAGGDDALLSHWACCCLAGLVRWDGRTIEVTIRGTSHRSRPGIRFHRARSLDPRDTTRLYGIPCTTPARAILEIAPQLSDRQLKRLIRKAQAEKRANVRQIAAVLRRARGHPATRRIADIIASGPAPTASGHEDVVLDLILDAGFAHPAVNVALHVTANPYTPDLRWPAQRLILEIDSGWHDGHIAQTLRRRAPSRARSRRRARAAHHARAGDPRPAPARRAPRRGRRAAPVTAARHGCA